MTMHTQAAILAVADQRRQGEWEKVFSHASILKF